MSKKCEISNDGFCPMPDLISCTPNECKGHCPHEETALRVIERVVNCETTVTECLDCGAWLDKPKKECR